MLTGKGGATLVINLIISLVGLVILLAAVEFNKPLDRRELKGYRLAVYPLVLIASIFIMAYTGYNLTSSDFFTLFSYLFVFIFLIIGFTILANSLLGSNVKMLYLTTTSITILVLGLTAYYGYNNIYLGNVEEVVAKQPQSIKVADLVEKVTAKEYKQYCGTEENDYYPACYDKYSTFIEKMYTEPNKGEFVDFHYNKFIGLSQLSNEVESVEFKVTFLDDLLNNATTLELPSDVTTLLTNEKTKMEESLATSSNSLLLRQREFENLTKLSHYNFQYMQAMGWVDKGVEYRPSTTVETDTQIIPLDTSGYIDKVLMAIKATPTVLEWGQKYKEGNAVVE